VTYEAVYLKGYSSNMAELAVGLTQCLAFYNRERAPTDIFKRVVPDISCSKLQIFHPATYETVKI
jgi:hypothetical protein